MNNLSLTIKQYQLLTDWYLSALDEIIDNDGSKSVNGFSNSLEWIAGHLLIGRYNNIRLLGGEIDTNEHLDKFIDRTIPPPRNTVAFNPNLKYPKLSECREKWTEYSSNFISLLKNANALVLDKELPSPVLTGGNKIADLLQFLILHETYHIGQLSILRKVLGYKPMLLGWRN